MAGFDGRGPQGMGPMTGRARGRCNSAAGWGMPFGRGRCFGRRAGASPNFAETPYPTAPADELALLKAQANSLKETFDRMIKRIDELEEDGG